MATNQPPQNSFGLGNMDHLKSHILTMFAINGNKNGNSEDGIFMAIWAIMLITIIDVFFRNLPVILGKIENATKYFIKKKFDSTIPSVISSALTNSDNSENQEKILPKKRR